MAHIVIDLDAGGSLESPEVTIARGDGHHQVDQQGEYALYADVAGGAITKYSAEKNGVSVPVQMYVVEVSPADATLNKIAPADMTPADEVIITCWRCICVNNSCACVPCAK